MPQKDSDALSGLFLIVTRANGTKTKRGKALSRDAVVQAIGEPDDGPNAWVPIIFHGLRDFVKRADVEAAELPRVAKPTAAQLAARRRLLQKAPKKTTRSKTSSRPRA